MDSFFNIFFKKKNSAPRNEGGIALNYEQLGKLFSHVNIFQMVVKKVPSRA
jgi:hypothetical protein